MGILMLGAGLQGTLLGLRATIEGFPTPVTGLVMSCYYVGYLLGTLIAHVVAGHDEAGDRRGEAFDRGACGCLPHSQRSPRLQRWYTRPGCTRSPGAPCV